MGRGVGSLLGASLKRTSFLKIEFFFIKDSCYFIEETKKIHDNLLLNKEFFCRIKILFHRAGPLRRDGNLFWFTIFATRERRAVGEREERAINFLMFANYLAKWLDDSCLLTFFAGHCMEREYFRESGR